MRFKTFAVASILSLAIWVVSFEAAVAGYRFLRMAPDTHIAQTLSALIG
jgi:hypothetical protein